MDQLILALLTPPAPSFENFVPGRNAEALQAVRDLAAGVSKYAVVYLWGEASSGRSHLLSAARDAARAGGTRDLVVVDDVDAQDAEAQHRLFTQAVDALAGQGSVLASGDLPPVSLRLREDLRTRLGAGLVFRLHTLTDEDKVAALRVRAAHLGLELSRDITAYMLAHCPRDMGALFSMLDALDRASVKQHRPVSIALLRECLGQK